MFKRTLWAALAVMTLLLGGCVVVQPEHATEEHADANHNDGASSEQIYQVVVTTYLLDNAGLHDMDVAINEEGIIEPYFAGNVRRIHRVIAITAWPAELHEGAEALLETLAALAEALANDDVEAAGPLAADAHEQQHDLSHDVDHWLEAHGVDGGGSH